MVCTTDGTGSCRQPGCTYQVQFIACKERGRTRCRTGRRRTAPGHARAVWDSPAPPSTRASLDTLPLYAALTTSRAMRPPGRPTQWCGTHNKYHKDQMTVISLYKEPVGKQLREGVDIVARNQTILLKSKEEFLQGAVPNTIKHFIADLPVWLSSTNIFFKESALGRFFHRVAMSVYVCMYLSLCLSLFMYFFSRPLIGPQVT